MTYDDGGGSAHTQIIEEFNSINMTQSIVHTDIVYDGMETLLQYIKKLELSIAEKDDLLASKDRKILALEESISQSMIKTFGRAAHAPARSSIFSPSILNHVSDDSIEIPPFAKNDESPNQSLSLILHAHSYDEDSVTEQAPDGRWNIPFDEASFDELVAKVPESGEKKRSVLAEIGFIPIGKPNVLHSSYSASSPLRPLALRRTSYSPRRGLSKVSTNDKDNEKENATPKKDSIGTIALFNVR